MVTPDLIQDDEKGGRRKALSYIISLCQPAIRLFEPVDIRSFA